MTLEKPKLKLKLNIPTQVDHDTEVKKTPSKLSLSTSFTQEDMIAKFTSSKAATANSNPKKSAKTKNKTSTTLEFDEYLNTLRQKFPVAFPETRWPPLAIGIHKEIAKVLGISNIKAQNFMYWYTNKDKYIKCLIPNISRVDLNGNPTELKIKKPDIKQKIKAIEEELGIDSDVNLLSLLKTKQKELRKIGGDIKTSMVPPTVAKKRTEIHLIERIMKLQDKLKGNKSKTTESKIDAKKQQ